MKTAEAIAKALDEGVQLLRECIRDGPTSTETKKPMGKGWHDFYREKDRTAGAHASLEGFLTCKLPAIQRRLPPDALNVDVEVFENYLVPLFNPKSSDGWPPKKEDQRSEADVTTIKLAKFAQCCHETSSPLGKTVVHFALQRLNENAEKSGIARGHSVNMGLISFNPPSAYATAELLRARLLWEESEDQRDNLLRLAERFLSPKEAPLHKNMWKLDHIPWLRNALPILNVLFSMCGAMLNEVSETHSTRNALMQILGRFLKQSYFTMGDLIIETYSFKDRGPEAKQRTDYVSFETSLLLCQTILGGIKQGLVPVSWLNHLQPMMLSWIGARETGYCQDIFTPEEIEHQKNRFSYLCAILRTLADAEEVFANESNLHSPSLPMYVNPIRFIDRGIVPDGKTAFLAMPFSSDPVFSKIETELRKACLKESIDLRRTDDLKDPALDIPQKIWRDILESEFVVALCDGKNANVYYEIGLAHAIGRPVFLCARDRSDFTFDVGALEYCVFENTPDGYARLTSELVKFIAKVKPKPIL